MWNPLLSMPPKNWHNNSFLGSVKSLKLYISGSTKFFTHCCYFLRWAYYLGPKLKSQNLQQDSLGCVFPNIVAIRYENEIFFRPDYFDYQIKICKFLPNFLKFGNWARCFDKFFQILPYCVLLKSAYLITKSYIFSKTTIIFSFCDNSSVQVLIQVLFVILEYS